MRHVKTANGIRKKIFYGFVTLGSLLFFSGLISVFELSKLSRTTQNIMDTSIKDVELSKSMLDAVQEQNTALLQMVIYNDRDSINADSILVVGKQNFADAFNEAAKLHRNTAKLNGISAARDNYNRVVSQIYADSIGNMPIKWFTNVYKTSYYDLTLAIKNFMIDTQHTIDKNTARLQANAYRAIMPGIITLGVAIIIIIIFYGLVDLYYIKPVLKITYGLRNYLGSKIPFNVKVDGHDEIKELKEHIDELVSIVKRKE